MGPIRNPNWSTSVMRVTLSYLELHYCSYRDPISEKFNVTDGIRYLDFLHHKPTLSGINKKKSLHIYFNKNRHNMALSIRMGHGREKVISAYDFIWWLVKVVTRARVRFQIRIFFITSLLRH